MSAADAFVKFDPTLCEVCGRDSCEDHLPTAPDAVAITPTRRHFRVYDDVAINERPTPAHRWAGRLQEAGVAFIVGQTESWKTFVALDLALSSLRAIPCLGADVLPSSAELYVAAEGASGLKARIGAWKTSHGLSLDQRLGLQIVDGAVNLFSGADTQTFIDEQVTPRAPVNVTIDTFARCFVGGDENSAKDTGLAVDHAFRIRDAARGAVTILHHVNAAESRERGSTVMKAGVDNMLMLAKTDDLVTMSSAKNKDMEAFDPVLLKLTVVLGSASCVVRLARDVVRSDDLTPAKLTALTALWDTFGADGATSIEWHKALPSMAERTFYYVRKALTDAGYVDSRGHRFIPRRRP